MGDTIDKQSQFQSTPSARRATNPSAQKARRSMYFNPRPPRGERPTDYSKAVKEAMISIHALREEGDRGLCSMQSPRRYFNPRPPRGERPAASSASAAKTSISIHALREESDQRCSLWRADRHSISIHALRGESDEYLGGGRYHVNIFQSTPSARRATSPAAVYGYALEISIHALREEGDAEIVPSADTETPISIHALREEGDPVP